MHLEFLLTCRTATGVAAIANQRSGVLSSACRGGDGLVVQPSGQAVAEGYEVELFPYTEIFRACAAVGLKPTLFRYNRATLAPLAPPIQSFYQLGNNSTPFRVATNLQEQYMANIDSRALRNAFGAFATGVTVITTKGADGKDYGLTANSFSSVSLEPPLLLWCLGDKTDCYEVFQSAEYYAVHILATDQQNLSNQFASKGADKFAGVDIERGPGNIPMLAGSVARFVCKAAHKYPGGDHVIHVGEVLEFSQCEVEPLLFHKGKYAKLG